LGDRNWFKEQLHITHKHQETFELVQAVQKPSALFRLRPDGKMSVNCDWSTGDQRLQGAKRAAGVLAVAMG
jgi:hypothetical protein